MWLCAACLAGLALRLPLWTRFPLREDEALYGYWALHFLHEDPYFLTVWPDKPPVFLWLLAGVLGLFAPETPAQAEAAMRWLNIGISVITIPVAASVARRWWGLRAGWVAGLALAFNPFAVAFGPTVYTDPLLVLGGMLALASAVYGRWFWAGLWLGVAIMTKQQGLLYVPLIVALWWQARMVQPRTTGGNDLVRLLGGAALIVLPVLYWDSLRWAVAPSPWDLAPRTYSPLGMAPPEQWAARAQQWLGVGWYLAGAWWLWLLLGAGVLAGTAWERGVRLSGPVWLGLWAAAFVGVHLVSTVQVWDRYWLPLAPVVALGIARLAAVAWGGDRQLPAHRASIARLGLPLLLVVGLAAPGWHASQGWIPIGGDHGDYAGLHEAMQWLDQHAGSRYVLYHQTLGWHYLFYYYAEQRSGTVQTRWFSGPAALADNAAKTPYPPKYLILPDWAPQPQAAIHLATRGLQWIPHTHTGRMRVVEILPVPRVACDWCICRTNAGEPEAAFTLWVLALSDHAGMMSKP